MSSDTPTTLTDFNDGKHIRSAYDDLDLTLAFPCARSTNISIAKSAMVITFIVALRCYTQVRFNRAITGSDGLVVVATVSIPNDYMTYIVLIGQGYYAWNGNSAFCILPLWLGSPQRVFECLRKKDSHRMDIDSWGIRLVN